MKVLFVNPLAYGFELSKSIMPPLGLSMLGAVAEKHRHRVKIIDCMLRQIKEKSYTEKAFLRDVADFCPDIIMLTATTFNRFDCFRTANILKTALKDVPLVMGGIHATFTAEDTLSHVKAIDILCRGEGEKTIVELLDKLGGDGIKISTTALETINGISYRRGNEIVHNPEREFIKDLDELPMSAHHLLEIEDYKQVLPWLDIPAALVMTSRGCPARCSFCSTSVMWGLKIRCRSPENILDEIEHLFDKYGAKGVWFFDDTLTFNRAHIEGLLSEINKRGMKFPWYCEIRVDTVDFDRLKRMKEAGCYYVSFGIESASENVLKNINKGINLRQVENVMSWCKQLDLKTKAFFLSGHPGETYGEAEETLNFYNKNRRNFDIARFSTGVSILPGTEVERFALENGCIPENFRWSENYYCADNLTLGRDPYTPLLIQRQLGFSELRRLKYRSSLKYLFSAKVIKTALLRMRSWKSIKKYSAKYLLDFLEMIKLLFRKT
ncbi:MAG: radical SAM protein [bacterium]|nr:radical SAM protein [bacterium]